MGFADDVKANARQNSRAIQRLSTPTDFLKQLFPKPSGHIYLCSHYPTAPTENCTLPKKRLSTLVCIHSQHSSSNVIHYRRMPDKRVLFLHTTVAPTTVFVAFPVKRHVQFPVTCETVGNSSQSCFLGRLHPLRSHLPCGEESPYTFVAGQHV